MTGGGHGDGGDVNGGDGGHGELGDNTRDRELDALLRQPSERLSPPEGSWERVARRGRRRKWAKATIAAAAGVVVAAGAVPAVIAVRHTSNDQSLEIGRNPHDSASAHKTPATGTKALPTPSSTAVAPPALDGFTPTSVSFVSQQVGWLWGSGRNGLGTVALTRNAGASWVNMPSPNEQSVAPGGVGDYGIRFATGDIGYVFGARLFLTQDASARWTPISLPGPVIDLEAMNNRVWALVRTSSATLTLYGASTDSPASFAPVSGVPPLTGSGNAGANEAGSIAVNGAAVFVQVGRGPLWFSQDGSGWSNKPNPCPTSADFASSLTAWSATGVAVLCGNQVHGSANISAAYESSDSGHQWKPLPAPPAGGYSPALSAGTPSNIVLGTADGAGGYFTTDAGSSWTPSKTQMIRLSFVGFISSSDVVGLPDPQDETRAFLYSKDAGKIWHVTRFPK